MFCVAHFSELAQTAGRPASQGQKFSSDALSGGGFRSLWPEGRGPRASVALALGHNILQAFQQHIWTAVSLRTCPLTGGVRG